MTASEIRERATAEHESGHAVAVAALGGMVTSIRVGFDGLALDGAAGEVWHSRITDPRDFAIVSFAGVIGASFCEGVHYGLVEPSRQTSIMRYFRERARVSNSKRSAGVERTAIDRSDLADPDALRRLIRAGGSSDFHEAWRTLQKGRDRIEAENLFCAGQKMAMVLMAVHLQTIRGLAVALLDKRLLSGADLAGLLGGVKRVSRSELADLANAIEPD